ncbi:lipoprotein-releasing system permease protein [Epilithonimonas bovis DSM 19482]|uniref:Lipoprotein-releasing system permease protein n=1 Tax=Epilithonimonas bovis DSM 19482 TaxID=1121284 RepID=A0A1U7PXV3_9FLAO|nr:FtsX-like permease family protein [Epilithonimonas bovis]QIY85112.1 ABC transporter permease [Chryseobacterium sp. NEB161]SIT96598.1 lipoprotein-releasing system permease protein [Epilithonimonas bovis DSM 19482]
MNFPLYFSKKIAFSKDNKNNLSKVIVYIGRLSVALGIIVSLITISTGLGSKRAIEDRISNFSGDISVKSTRSNSSYNSSVLDTKGLDINAIKATSGVAGLQSYASVSGILRTDKDFAGVILKGVGKDFDKDRFQPFMIAGSIPDYNEDGYNNEIILSEKIANDLALKANDSIVAIFSKEDQKPIYRKFLIKGIYKTDIKLVDDLYMIGDINHVRKVMNMGEKEVGGLDIFLDDTDKIDSVFPKIEKYIGYKNYAEKVTEKYPQILDWVNIFNQNISLIIAIMLIVVVINIIMVLLILIIERTNSIGLLKTFGASNAQIRSIFINYTLLIMVPGLLAGNAIGIGLLLIQKYTGVIKLDPQNYFISTVPVELNPFYIISVSVGIFIVSGIAMILPSYLISRISPLKAIKYS